MDGLIVKQIETKYGIKTISVHVMDIKELSEHLDIMTVSAFYRDYAPVPRTMIRALDDCGISVAKLSKNPEIDLREFCNIWLSEELVGAELPVGRIGCIEMSSPSGNCIDNEGQMLSSIQSYFRMLDLASLSGIRIETVGLPILGGGNQQIPMEMITIPVINECIRFLKNNECVQKIRIITSNEEQALKFARVLKESYVILHEETNINNNTCSTPPDDKMVFISHSSKDKNVADNLCCKLESNGIKVWYAPRDIKPGAQYAGEIVKAINKCSHFAVLLSVNSLKSEHVLNEIDLAFEGLNRPGKKIRFLPIRLDETELGPDFKYYLSRQHWMDMCPPLLEEKLHKIVKTISEDEH